MAINEAVNIGINVDGTASVQQASNAYEDLGDAVAKTQLEAEKLAQQFGINDARTQEAIKTAGKYKQQMEQLDFAIDAARGGSDQLFRATQGVVAGFEVAAGAMALFGSESEELQKILMKVQGAMALSQGLKDLNEFSPAIKNVASAFSGVLTKAVQGFSKAAKAAMAATGIGLLVVAVASLVEYWDDIMEAVNGVSSEQKDLVKEQQKSADLASKQLDDISAQENILKQQGKTEEDILKMKIAASKNAITALEAQLTTQQEMKKSQIDAAKRNKEILQGIIQFISLPLTGLLMTVDAVGKAFGKDFGLNEKFAGGLANLVFDPKAVEEEADKTIQTTQDNLNKLKNSVAGYEMQVGQIRQQAAQKLAEEQKKKAEEDAKRLEDEFQAWQNQEIANQEYRDQLAEEQRKKEEEEFEQWQAQEIANYEYRTQLAEKEAEEEKARKQAVADLEQKLFDESQALANAVISLAGQQSKIGKAVALASIAADTARALTSALANSQSPTPDNVATGGLAGIAKYIALATTILTNSKRAYDIIKAPAPSGATASGGGASLAAATSVPTFQAPSVRLGVQGEQFTQVNRVYVTEADISGTQNRVKVTEGISTI
jgi:flagellar biosynthesis GTPase FlhF